MKTPYISGLEDMMNVMSEQMRQQKSSLNKIYTEENSDKVLITNLMDSIHTALHTSGSIMINNAKKLLESDHT
jgi:hypothetical protein